MTLEDKETLSVCTVCKWLHSKRKYVRITSILSEKYNNFKKRSFKLVIERQMYSVNFIVSFTRKCIAYTLSQILQIFNIHFNIILQFNLVF